MVGDWYLLYSKPGQERLLKGQLEQRGIETFLPLCPPCGRQRTFHPLFPRYLFTRPDPEQMSPEVVNWLPGLTCFVRFAGEYAKASEAVVSFVRCRAAEMRAPGAAAFSSGQSVRIVGDHLLASLNAVFDRPLSGGARARILIELLGRLTRCDIDMCDLEPVEGALPRWAAVPVAARARASA